MLRSSDNLAFNDFNDEDMRPGTDTWLSACQTVRKAFEDHGCFMALYDKPGLELYNSVFSAMERLFDLPLETKKQETSDKLFHGPREIVNKYANVVGELDRMVKRMVFENYGVDKQRSDSFLESNSYLLRGIKYRTAQTDESNMGLHGHSDVTVLSILQQYLSGLEIKLKNGEWVEVDPSPSLFVVMAG
ncbi:hypothetical protein L6164_034178 [Bauhinia variegata]|uniref:Uncharacterized protein n=1 Tax=Bauhinia variegata TaxID=167791 RepID=A0ACB9KUV7_BAUVA|nr:hypothetical protein L6164_034178 [Bauhinia variegata]